MKHLLLLIQNLLICIQSADFLCLKILCPSLCIKIRKNHKFFLIYLHISKFITTFANQKRNTMPVTKQKLIRHYALDRCLM